MEQIAESPRTKALKINLNPKIFGTIAEIGAGQEVARRFFIAGGSSGTVAKTISAYDMALSDKIYGTTDDKRYVSRERLEKMLKVEFESLTEVLYDKKDEQTCFFAFANTVSAINFHKDNEPHGWVGIRYQLEPRDEPNEIIMHIRMYEPDNFLQQRTLGILGVNFIYAAYYYYDKPNSFLKSLLDYISTDQVEVDMITMNGPQLDYVDNRLLGVQLVKNKMTNAVLFDRNMNIGQPFDIFYKKNIMFLRGSFRPITYVGFDMIKAGFSMFKKDIKFTKDNTLIFCEISLNNLYEKGALDERDFLDRVLLLTGMGMNVMVSSFQQHHELVSYFTQFKIIKLGIVAGIINMKDVLKDKYYRHLRGGILEASSLLFVNNMKLYIYPAKKRNSEELLTLDQLKIAPDVRFLLEYFKYSKKIVEITDVNKSKLHIFSKEVLRKIHKNDPDWEKMVPKYVSRMIKEHKMFGFSGW